MKLWEAAKAMDEGKKVRVNSWAKDEYIYLKNDEFYNHHGIKAGSLQFMNLKDLFACVWELHEEKKHKFEVGDLVNCYNVQSLNAGKIISLDNVSNTLLVDMGLYYCRYHYKQCRKLKSKKS